jgi:ATP-dependent DNA helicase RecG
MRTQAELQSLLHSLITGWEGECVEFKEANDNFSTPDIGKYFSALSNEANLRGLPSAWLIFGVKNSTRTIVGTSYRTDKERLHSLKQQIAVDSDPSTSFREIHELHTLSGRVILFEIPPAPRGIPMGWSTHYYARNGESLTGLSIAKLDEIRAQAASEDWSAVICREASLNDLSPEALIRARESYLNKYSDRIPASTIQSWDHRTFLEKAKLTLGGEITRACLLLLGRAEAARHLMPAVAEISWKLEGVELAYEHFHPPFLLATSLLYQRIRNNRLTVLPIGQLIPVEVAKYDQRIVLEALHNCVAHQDYTRQERILVIERVGELLFQNAGSFYDGTPDDYILGNKTPTRYRNRLLAQAMVHLRMIDTMGFGIREVMCRGQASRYLPLPDYDKTGPDHVVMRLQGRFLDENYSRVLLSNPDLNLSDIRALDLVQKGIAPSPEVIASLRHRKLIEGRKPHLHISSRIAATTGQKANYIRTRQQDDRFLEKLVLDYLSQWHQANRKELDELLWQKLPESLPAKTRNSKIHNLLTRMRKAGAIVNTGSRRASLWKLPSKLMSHP